MKQVFLLVIIQLFSNALFGQKDDDARYQDTVFIRYNKSLTDKMHYVTDTVIFKTEMRRHILLGTTILPGTASQIGAMNYGLYFTKVSKSDCQKDITEYAGSIPDKINSIDETDTTLTVDMNISANCCHDFLCDIDVDSTGVLNLIYEGYGTYCSCDCCFGLTYHFNREKSKDVPEIKSIMINGNRKTIKPIKKKK
jgi:hypothetical protein